MKFYNNNEFATALVAEFVRSNDFEEVAMEKELTKGIEVAKAEKDDFFDEVKKASKKARNGRSFTKLERAQMKKDAAMKRAKIEVLTNEELGLSGQELVSHSKVTGLVPPPAAEVGCMLTGADDIESAGNLVQTLISKHLV